ncbi:MAG: hypothetical protein RR472_01290 [Anaerovoracaceae bacterium]
MKTALKNRDNVLLSLESTKKSILAMEEYFPKEMVNSGLDEVITGMIEQVGMTPNSLLINGEAVISANGEKATTGNETLSKAGETPQEASAPSETPGEGTTETKKETMKTDVLTINATGDLNQFYRLMDLVAKEKGMIVKSFDIKSQSLTKTSLNETLLGSNGRVGNKEKGEYLFQIIFEVSQIKGSEE